MSLHPSRSPPKEHRPGKVLAWCADTPELDYDFFCQQQQPPSSCHPVVSYYVPVE